MGHSREGEEDVYCWLVRLVWGLRRLVWCWPGWFVWGFGWFRFDMDFSRNTANGGCLDNSVDCFHGHGHGGSSCLDDSVGYDCAPRARKSICY